MHIKISFEVLSSKSLAIRDLDPQLDDIRSILTDICNGLADIGHFSISGFGQMEWPVDMRTDLPVFLEQFPDLIQNIYGGESARVEFYEQGIERTIDFNLLGNDYILTCSSMTSWQPNPRDEKMSRVDAQEMLLDFKKRFLLLIDIVAPQLFRNSVFNAWKSGLIECN